jgi:Uma2 family endonuclease
MTVVIKPESGFSEHDLLQNTELFAHRKRWTRSQCDDMERYGFLTTRYELLDGEIIEKLGQNQPHAMSTSRIIFYLMGLFGPARVQTQTTIEVIEEDRTTNRPQPDVFVLSKPDREFQNTPEGNELQLIVEVSDSTLRDDLVTKATLYARAGVPEYWVMDIQGRRLLVHLKPVNGAYTETIIYSETESVAPQAAADQTIRVSELLPPLSITNA